MAAKQVLVKRYVVKLNGEERAQLDALLRKGKSPARWLLKARILLKADVSPAGEGWSDSRIIKALDTNASMIYRVRKQLVEEGFEAVLFVDALHPTMACARSAAGRQRSGSPSNRPARPPQYPRRRRAGDRPAPHDRRAERRCRRHHRPAGQHRGHVPADAANPCLPRQRPVSPRVAGSKRRLRSSTNVGFLTVFFLSPPSSLRMRPSPA
jgi:hypothetical protein